MSSIEEFQHLRLPFKILESATNNFSDTNCIGRGGFGKVYKGAIPLYRGLTMVAIKRLDRTLGQGTTEFWKEIMMLSQYKHKNLVSLLGFCVEGGENIIVYEYLSNRSLDLYLNSVDLSWHQRLIICLGAAMGLRYLHKPLDGSQQRVLHRDIKSANILLDHNWRAKIADFGLSKLGPANQKYTFLYSNAVGTMGYCDPLYADTGFLTKESDVYSFGVVLFEVLCGRLCVIQKYDDIRRSLTALSRKCYEEKKMHTIIHIPLQDNISPECLERFSAIAYQCLHLDRAKRPTMDKVVEELRLALDHQERPDRRRPGAESHLTVYTRPPTRDERGKSVILGIRQDRKIWEKHICILLHGTLHVTIFEVDKIRGYGGGRNIFGKLKANLKKNVGFGKGTTKMYATIDLDKCRVGRTSFVENERVNPRWYESFRIYCAHSASNVIFTVKDDNPIGATLIGRAYVPVADLLEGEEVDRWVEILDEEKNPVEADSKIHVKLQYFDVTQDCNWARGIRTAKYAGVPYTFFPQRKGCRVSLYQDAHVPDNFIPPIPLAGGKYYEPHRCWEDVFDAISNAKLFIYITGWSVYTEISLIRDSRRPKPRGDLTLGELLKYKASEGVRVLMLVWDDRTSVDVLKKDGLMATHGEETKRFFQDTNVHCTLCSRKPDDSGSFRKGLQLSTMFTHNQKIIAVDSPLPNGDTERRRVVSFVGGLDLCDGRYDSPFHSLFRTLDTIHHDDFHQPHYAEAAIDKGGPREPWHDIHSKLEGPIAWDVLYNFEQRWRKQGGKNVLVNVKELDEIIPPSPVMFYDDPESWNVQLFRSIDGGAAFGFPDTPEEAERSGLLCVKDNIIDRSIQDAYIHAIRRAKNFIYIENQFFLGSSFGWQADDIKVEDVGALHLIPKELSLKIMSKIKAGEKFTVYVVIPMWPGGIPKGASVQAILDWQRRTMEMMYKDIIKALNARGIEDDPRDYLTFFCLGNREVKRGNEFKPFEAPKADSDYQKAQEARRFMIYVHAKMMIVDDEYIIVGSANINQRSMDGARDSEIAMGAYQPHHIATRTPARGQVHGFRMSLWYEHIGFLDDSFLHPESTECVNRVNQIADKYWDLYSSENLESDLPGHLLRYPIGVSSEGDVTNLPGSEFFPDTNARILGTKSDHIPSILTT